MSLKPLYAQFGLSDRPNGRRLPFTASSRKNQSGQRNSISCNMLTLLTQESSLLSSQAGFATLCSAPGAPIDPEDLGCHRRTVGPGRVLIHRYRTVAIPRLQDFLYPGPRFSYLGLIDEKRLVAGHHIQ